MKSLIRNSVIFGFTLFFLPQFIPGVVIQGGLMTILIGGIALGLMFLILKPILNIISFPINMLTLGIFSIFTNALILYLLTVFVTDISVTAFTYHTMSFSGFVIPTITFNTFFAYLYTAFILAIIDSFVSWLMR